MWGNWEKNYDGRKIDRAILKDYRRSFNKLSVVNWGSSNNGCPTLGLENEQGSVCVGVAFEFDDSHRDSIISMLRRREGSSFELKELNVTLPDGSDVLAITPVNKLNANTYIGDIMIRKRAEMAKVAKGKEGSCIEYIEKIRHRLQGLEIEDASVEEFYHLIINGT